MPENRVDFRNYNVLRMISPERSIKIFGRFDVIYSVGLCDYLGEKALVPLIRTWREMLNKQGVLYVSFKDATRYDKTEYQWFVDWHFEQRTEDDCRRLLGLAGYPEESITMHRDPTGVMMIFAAARL